MALLGRWRRAGRETGAARPLTGELPPVQPLPGSEALLAVHAEQVPQPDQLCGAFWAALAVHALAPERGPVDLAAAAGVCGSWVYDADLRSTRPPGEPMRRHGWEGAPRAAREAPCGTSCAGVLSGIDELAYQAAAAMPIRGPWDAPWTVQQVLDALTAVSSPGVPVVVLANLDTGRLWGSHATDRQLMDYLNTGHDSGGPAPDWSVGHFVALWGRIDGPRGTLIAVADTYPSLGRGGLHLQPASRVAAALSRDAPGRGGLLVVARDLRSVGSAVNRLIPPSRAGREWDNGSRNPPPRPTVMEDQTDRYAC